MHGAEQRLANWPPAAASEQSVGLAIWRASKTRDNWEEALRVIDEASGGKREPTHAAVDRLLAVLAVGALEPEPAICALIQITRLVTNVCIAVPDARADDVMQEALRELLRLMNAATSNAVMAELTHAMVRDDSDLQTRLEARARSSSSQAHRRSGGSGGIGGGVFA